MAAGDYDVKYLSRTNLPGGGFNSTGVPTQGKISVVALVTGYYVTGGIVLAPKDLGLEVIDFITTEVVSVNNDGTVVATGALPQAGYIRGTNKLLIDITEDTEATNNQTFTVRVFVTGDTAASAELL
jgi:hypothetical protein